MWYFRHAKILWYGEFSERFSRNWTAALVVHSSRSALLVRRYICGSNEASAESVENVFTIHIHVPCMTKI